MQVSCPIYAMGSEAENIYKSFVFAEERHKTDFDIVLEKFDGYFFSEGISFMSACASIRGCNNPARKQKGL